MPISAAAAVRIRRANPVVTARFSLRVLPAGSRVQRAQERSLYLRGNCHALLRHRIDIGLEKSTLWRVMLKPLSGRRHGDSDIPDRGCAPPDSNTPPGCGTPIT